MEQTIEEVLNRLVEVEDTALRMREALEDQKKELFSRMEEEKRWLSVNLACEKTEEEGYITIEGEEHIRDKIQNLMEKAEERVYLSCSRACLDGLGNELGMLVKEGRKLVLITDAPYHLQGALVYVTEEKGFQRYVVEVNKNGYLLLEVYSVTGLHSSHGMQIDSIDDQAPSITSHFESGGNIYVYLTDGEGSGVDYPSVCVSDPAAGSCCAPLYYDEQYGYVVLPYPETEVYITVPDKEGNEMTALLAPSESPE